MPVGSEILPAQYLEALELWIDAGASEDALIPEAQELLIACVPEPDHGSLHLATLVTLACIAMRHRSKKRTTAKLNSALV